jgi:hypothetical protein
MDLQNGAWLSYGYLVDSHLTPKIRHLEEMDIDSCY